MATVSILGTSCMEIYPDPQGSASPELIPKKAISGVYSIKYQQREFNDIDWVYPFNSITKIVLRIVDGRKIELELQNISNQPGWNNGTIGAQQQAVSSIQDWLANGGTLNPPPEQEYYLRKVSENNIFPPMDGVEMVGYNGNLKIMFGWNPNLSGYPLLPFPETPDSNYVFDSPNEGRDGNWIQGSDSLAVPTHGQGIGVRADGKIWHWGLGGETHNTESFVWTYDDVNGWVQISSDWTLGRRIAHKSFLHKNYLYSFGGQDSINIAMPSSFSNMYRSSNGITWNFMSILPTEFMTASTAWTDNVGNLYITGGGELNSSGHGVLVQWIYKSDDDGLTWTIYAPLPTNMQSVWADAYVWDNKVWYVNGYKNGSNKPGLYYSLNWGLSWSLLSLEMPARHLTAITVLNDHLHIVCGNLWNDHWRVEKITYPQTTQPLDPDVKIWYQKIYPEDRPTLSLLNNYNDLVIGIKSDTSLNGLTSNYDELDVLQILAGLENESQVLMPLKTSKPGFNNGPKKVLSPSITFTGVTGNGSTTPALASGLSCNWNNGENGIKFTTNFASVFAFSMTAQIEDTNDFGNTSTVIDFCQIGNTFYGQINNQGEAAMSAVDGRGYRGVSRFDSNNIELINETTHLSAVRSSATGTTAAFGICGVPFGPNSYLIGASKKTFGAYGMGSGDLDHGKMRSRLRTFFIAQGLTV